MKILWRTIALEATFQRKIWHSAIHSKTLDISVDIHRQI